MANDRRLLKQANARIAAMRKAMLSASKYGHPDHSHMTPERWDGKNTPCRKCIAWNRAMRADHPKD